MTHISYRLMIHIGDDTNNKSRQTLYRLRVVGLPCLHPLAHQPIFHDPCLPKPWASLDNQCAPHTAQHLEQRTNRPSWAKMVLVKWKSLQGNKMQQAFQEIRKRCMSMYVFTFLHTPSSGFMNLVFLNLELGLVPPNAVSMLVLESVEAFWLWGWTNPQKLGQKHHPNTKPAVAESAAKFKTPKDTLQMIFPYFSIGNLTQQQTRQPGQPGLQPGLLKVSSGMVPSLVNSAFSPSPLQGMDGTPAVCARMPAAILSPSTDLKGWWVGSPTTGKIQLKIHDMIYQTCYIWLYIYIYSTNSYSHSVFN